MVGPAWAAGRGLSRRFGDDDRPRETALPSPLAQENAVISPVLPTYARADVTFERGDGPYLYATDGRKFLDFSSGVAVTCLGHAHPHLVAALTA